MSYIIIIMYIQLYYFNFYYMEYYFIIIIITWKISRRISINTEEQILQNSSLIDAKLSTRCIQKISSDWLLTIKEKQRFICKSFHNKIFNGNGH